MILELKVWTESWTRNWDKPHNFSVPQNKFECSFWKLNHEPNKIGGRGGRERVTVVIQLEMELTLYVCEKWTKAELKHGFSWSSQRRSNHVCVFVVLACCSLAILMGCVLCFCLHFSIPIPILGMDRQPGAILGDQEFQSHACRVIDGSQVYSLSNIFSSP